MVAARSRRVVLGGVVAAVVLVATACQTPWTGNHSGRTVAVFGDSIASDTYAGQEIDAALQDDFQTQRFAHPGWRFDQLLPSADTLIQKKQLPRRVVIELGTNDSIQIGQGTWTLEQTQTAIDQWMAKFPAAKCIVFVTVNAQRFVARINAASVSINDMIKAKQAADPRVVLADWDAMVLADYKLGSPNGQITVDGTHPSLLGQTMLAGLIDDAVHACPDT